MYQNPYHFNPYIISKNIRILGRVTSFFGTHGLDVGSFWRPESSTCPPAAATYAGVKNEGIFQAKSKSNLAGPKAALGKQKKCQICQSFIVEGEAAKSRFMNIKCHMQRPPQLNWQSPSRWNIFRPRFSKFGWSPAFPLVLGGSIRESCGTTVRGALQDAQRMNEQMHPKLLDTR